MTEAKVAPYRTEGKRVLRTAIPALVDMEPISKPLLQESKDGVHHLPEVYTVTAQLVANTLEQEVWTPPAVKTGKRASGLGKPYAGLLILAVIAVMMLMKDTFLFLTPITWLLAPGIHKAEPEMLPNFESAGNTDKTPTECSPLLPVGART